MLSPTMNRRPPSRVSRFGTAAALLPPPWPSPRRRLCSRRFPALFTIR